MKKNSKKHEFQHMMTGVLVVIFLECLSISCDDDDNDDPQVEIRPEGENPEWAPNIDPEMLAVIEQLDKLSPTPLYQLSVEAARNAPTPTDAVEALMEKYNIEPMVPKVTRAQRMIMGPDEDSIQVYIYTPQTNRSSYPMIVYFHGGGWVIANPDVYEPSAQALSEKADAIVVSVNYRKAPEHKFPAAHEDAFAAYAWARMNGSAVNGDTARVAVAGESAGANLAASVCLMAKEGGMPMPVHQLLVYPIADYGLESQSYQEYANAKPLSKPLMEWFFMHYLNNPEDGDSPWISLVDADVTHVPPATVITARSIR